MNDQLSTLKATVDKQASSISSIKNLKQELQKASANTVSQINELVSAQGQQVDTFKSSIKHVKQEILKEVNKKVKKVRKEARCQALKSQAFNNSLNLIIIGLAEAENVSTSLSIFAHLPKPLREGIQALYKVANEASKLDKFHSVRVHDYQLELEEETYQFSELEDLPFEIRPSTLAAPRSDTAMAFFSKNSFFSNHYISEMEIEGRTFSCMEHFLAFQRAVLSEKQPLIKRARRARDPLQAKH